MTQFYTCLDVKLVCECQGYTQQFSGLQWVNIPAHAKLNANSLGFSLGGYPVTVHPDECLTIRELSARGGGPGACFLSIFNGIWPVINLTKEPKGPVRVDLAQGRCGVQSETPDTFIDDKTMLRSIETNWVKLRPTLAEAVAQKFLGHHYMWSLVKIRRLPEVRVI